MISSAFIILITLCIPNIDCIAQYNTGDQEYHTSVKITNVRVSRDSLSKQLIVTGNVCEVIRLYLLDDTEKEKIREISKSIHRFIIDDSVEYHFYSGNNKLPPKEGEQYFLDLIKKVPKAVITLQLDTKTKKVIGVSRAEYLEESD